MWPRAGLPMLSTKKARSRASKPAVCGQSARPVLSEYAARPQKVRPAVGMDGMDAPRPDSARCGIRTRRSRWRAAVRIRAAQAGPTRRSPNGRVSSRIGAPRPSPIRRSPNGSPAVRIDAPQPNPRAKAGRGAPRFGLPCRRPPWRSAVWMDAAQRGQKAGSVPPFPPLPAGRSFCAGLRARAPLPFHAPNGQRCRVTVPAALQARRPPFRTARDISARSTSRRTSGRIAFVVCVYCLSPPTCSEKGLRRSPRNPSVQKAVKSDSLDNNHRNAVPNVKILLKTHSKQSKKTSKSNPLDDERRNVLPNDRSSFRMAQQTIRHLPAESEPVRQDETHKKPKTVDRTAFRLSAPH